MHDIQPILEALQDALLRKMGDEVDLIFQYGSHVRGATHRYSDVDLSWVPVPETTWESITVLHDWGAFPRFAQPDVEHALRSRQVAEAEILPSMDLSPAAQAVVLEAIELHDYRDPRPTRSVEALLLREADMIEFLGMIGRARGRWIRHG